MKVSIAGPNLRDQSRGQFVVHAADCADIKKAAKRDPAFSKREATVMDVDSAEQVVEEIYSDIMAENDTTAQEHIGDFHFAPCLDRLPSGPESEAASIPQSTINQEDIVSTKSTRNAKSVEQVPSVEVPEDQTPAFVISPEALQQVEDATNGNVSADALASAIADAPDMELGDPSAEPEQSGDDDDNNDDSNNESGAEASQSEPEAEAAPKRTINRGTYTDEQKARAHWVSDKYTRTGPDVVKAIELATLEVLDVKNLTLKRLQDAFANPAVCESIREKAVETCKYVTKTNVPRVLEAHIEQLS